MPLDHTKNMLRTLEYYCDTQITQTFSKDYRQFLSVCYQKSSKCFEVTYVETLVKEIFPDVESAAAAIEKALKN
ncbi:hypothetical protein DFO73_11536 [Cytobacillus oceanisediminis]|jgi:uncharacterized protein YkuJ|uniref:Uncharacterized protein n=1 Tax=Cytobacillus oceanisediminis TaxID=665099 RepID=A0A2V2ZLC4_9BACI|nr:hypothetical protein [Cytobacillus oceanisediminis]PWW20462.1 hypothetical protein DFO73_11536 [Cytobacillus oceanisediminis]